PVDDSDAELALKTSLDFARAGVDEDRDIARSIQRGLASRANEFFEFGRFEAALVNYHRALREALDPEADDGSAAPTHPGSPADASGRASSPSIQPSTASS